MTPYLKSTPHPVLSGDKFVHLEVFKLNDLYPSGLEKKLKTCLIVFLKILKCSLRTSLYLAPLRIMAAKCLRSDNFIVSFLFTFGALDLIFIFCRDFDLIIVGPGKNKAFIASRNFKNRHVRQKFREKSCPLGRPNIGRFFKF